jgi:hypothetical protein
MWYTPSFPSSGMSKSASTSADATCSWVTFEVATLNEQKSCRCNGQIGENDHFLVRPNLSCDCVFNDVGVFVAVRANDDTELITAALTSSSIGSTTFDRMVMVFG